ncbi:MAG: hypothetical protein U9R21_03990 [Candidatus Thermoplasmatota archaeon]|nr:hypothetical protein [Candidatus Thermoplasmatota archaeon]
MDDVEKIRIKLELCKDKELGLAIVAHFNLDAPNFFKEGESYLWRPTPNERMFISEAFELISTGRNETAEGKNVFKFSNSKPVPENTSDDAEVEPVDLPSFEKTDEAANPIKITARIGDFDNKADKEEEIAITKSDRKAIDEALDRHEIKEGGVSEDDKEKIIEKILSEKKRY